MENKPPAFNHAPTTAVVTMSPTDAQAYLEKRTFDRQRERKPERIARYKADMEAKNWGDQTVITVSVLPDGTEILANGHHRLWALSEAAPNTRVEFLVVKRYVATQADADKVFAVYEDRGVARDDSVAVYALLRGKITLLTQAQTRYALLALRIWETGFTQTTGNVNYKVDIITQANNLIATEQTWSRVIPLVAGANVKVRKQAYSSGVLAGIAAVVHVCGDPAIDFFCRALADDGLGLRTPEKKLYEYLREKRSSSQKGLYYSPVDQAKTVCAIWNMYRESRKRETSSVFVRIVGPGSPYNGKQRVLLVHGEYVPVAAERGAVLDAFEASRSAETAM
jgi:hypothetical protein